MSSLSHLASDGGADDTDEPQSFFVRALYDFTSADASSLTFPKGAIIEVLTQLESGWWDGLLGNDVRGWFPSNYVEPISDDEAEAELRARGFLVDDTSEAEDEVEGGTPETAATRDGGNHASTASSSRAGSTAKSADRTPASRYSGEGFVDAYSSLGIGEDFEALRQLMGNDASLGSNDAFGQLAEAAMLESLQEERQANVESKRDSSSRAGPTSGRGSTPAHSMGVKTSSNARDLQPRGTSTERERTRAYSASNTAGPSSSPVTSKTLAGRPRAATGSAAQAPPSSAPASARSKVNDFWVPKVTPRGEIIYHNTRTGEEALDLPTGADLSESLGLENFEDAVSEDVATDEGETTASSMRRGSVRNPISDIPNASSVMRPWRLRMTDDERSYFFYNTETREVSWEPPVGAMRRANVEGLGDTFADASGAHVVGGAESDEDVAVSGGAMRMPGKKPPSASAPATRGGSTSAPRPALVGSQDMPLALYHEQLDSLELQRRVMPEAPLPLKKYLARTSDALSQLAGIAAEPLSPASANAARESSPSEKLAKATAAVVNAVRELLYVAGSLSATPVDMVAAAELVHLPVDEMSAHECLEAFRTSLAALPGRYDVGPRVQPVLTVASQHSLQSVPHSLQPLTKKVSATLSKLVLSARAVVEQPGISANGIADLSPAQLEKLNSYRQRVQDEAIDLARAVGAFHVEMERLRATHGAHVATAPWMRRLRAVLDGGSGLAGVGLDTLGGGSAAGWRGSGFVLPTALQTAALEAEAQGSLQNPFELTRDTQHALASGKVAKHRNAAAPLGRERVEREWLPQLEDLRRQLVRARNILQTGESQPSHEAIAGADASIAAAAPPTSSAKPDGTARPLARRVARQLLSLVHAILARFGTVVALLEATDLASALDFDGPAGGGGASSAAYDVEIESYLATIPRAREAVQALAQTKQLLYDVGSALMLEAQEASMGDRQGSLGGDGAVGAAGVAGAMSLERAEGLLSMINAMARESDKLGGLVKQLLEISEEQRGEGLGKVGARAKVYGVQEVRLSLSRPAASLRQVARPGQGGVGPGAAGTGTGVDEDEEVMYLGPGLAVPNGPPTSRGSAHSSAPNSAPAAKSSTVTSLTATTASAASRARSTSVTTGASAASHDTRGSGSRRAADAELASSKSAEEVPWFLGPDYAPDEIVINPNGQVKGATLNALMERLTMHNAFDASFNNTFLMTYRSFTTTDDFLSLLFARFRIRPPVGLMPEEQQVWTEKKQMPIRLRVFNILKFWLESHFYEGEDEPHLVRIKDFALDEMAHSQAMETPAKLLIRLVERREGAGEQMVRKMVMPLSPPPPIMPKSRKLKFLDIDPLEMARQLTLIDSGLYNRVRPAEFLGKAWSRPDGAQVAKNIRAVIHANNRVSGWVSEAILTQEDLKKRAAWMKQFVAIADKCYTLNNFSSMMAIYSGLNNASLNRLKRTWDSVNQRHLHLFDNMKALLAPTKNFSKYRETLRNLNPPCVPFLGVYLTDLTFIEDGNSDTLKTDGRLINFSKRQMTAEKISEIIMLQSTPYNLQPVPTIQKFLEEHISDGRSLSEDELFEQSLRLEPREREDEKIARLLLESGFI